MCRGGGRLDTVGLLKRYRTSITADEQSFAILSWLYRNEIADEETLSEYTQIGRIELRNVIRRLFQSNLVAMSDPNSYAFTTVSERILSGLGADRFVACDLVNEIASDQDNEVLQNFIRFSMDYEPELARLTTIRYRNLRNYLAHTKGVSKDRRIILLWTTALHPDSKLRIVLGNHCLSQNALTKLIAQQNVSGSNLELTSSIDFSIAFVYLTKSLVCLEESDAFLVSAVADETAPLKTLSRTATDLLVLRFYNYYSPDYRDSILESSFKNDHHAIRRVLNRLRTSNQYTKIFAEIERKSDVVWKWAEATDLPALLFAPIKARMEPTGKPLSCQAECHVCGQETSSVRSRV
jgi:hypothetical protein